jgi:hypothetical protein
VHAVRPDSGGQARLGPDEEQKAAPMGDLRETAANRHGPWRAERPIDDAASARQSGQNHRRIRGSRRIGEEDESRQGLSPRTSGP